MKEINRVFITAEIGINHNGDLDLTKKLIDLAAFAGCDAVKFQKRTVEKVYTKEFLDSPRQSPWGATQREQKNGLEFGREEYDVIHKYCAEKGLEWYASAWDTEAQYFLSTYDLKYNKIASAMLSDQELLKIVAKEKKYTFLAVGMSTEEEISCAVDIFRQYDCPFELMHCVSTYPMEAEEANLRYIGTLREKYQCKVGFSSHEMGNICCYGAVALGAASIERHITLDRSMYGSDQKVSIEPEELIELVKNIRLLEKAMGSDEKRLSPRELETRKKLRGY